MTGIDAQYQATNAAEIDVDEGAQSLAVTTEWTCRTPLCDMHVYLCSPDERPILPVLDESCALPAPADDTPSA